MDFLQHYAKISKRNPILKAIVLHGLSPSAGLENISSFILEREELEEDRFNRLHKKVLKFVLSYIKM